MDIHDFAPSPQQEIRFLLLKRIDTELDIQARLKYLRVSASHYEDETLYTDVSILREKVSRILARIEELLHLIERPHEAKAPQGGFHSGDLVEAVQDILGGVGVTGPFIPQGTRLIVMGASGNATYPIVVIFEADFTRQIAVCASDIVKVSPPNSGPGNSDQTSPSL